MSNFIIDEIDLRILQFLLEDATRSHKDIGRLVHMTGQAVGARVRKLQDMGVIEGYTLRWNPEKIGQMVHAFVTVFTLSNTAHQSFQTFVQHTDQVVETHRVSGEGCYWMRLRVGTLIELNTILDELLKFGNYKVSLSIGQLK
ncbi:Lrp/AsnC family transcriptional regulator [Paenibacillus sp. N3.4]|uniref:Lrp/AsnC family transcriptional regulator n=1 Tax=Paenibacillus sp. N3.4 TaxID=2603222 RepID=UPI0011C95366|nr:Lrp/AsnC family transcriptional regulator [Paenibacillus sp. N3.4]TXK81839.1 Lrp/AsnC family transcriptional regulator [Paenibacillus sp. N3.4]